MVTSEPVNDKMSVSSNLCLTGDRYFEVYMRTKTIGDLYLPISYYKEAVKCGDMMSIKGLYKIMEEMHKIKNDPMIGGPNIRYLEVVIQEAEEYLKNQ